MNSSRVVTEQINRLPLDTLREVAKFHPLLIPPFTNSTLRRAVKDYVADGARKQRVVDKYGEISNWDVSNVTDMSWMFSGAGSFNQPLNNWNVSKVTNMCAMFWKASSFNQPLNNWDVSKEVTDMSWMFRGAISFNQPLNNWNVSNVITMECMFDTARSFNQPLNNWNVSNEVTDMDFMFDDAISFNQPLHAPWYEQDRIGSDDY